MFDNLLFFSTTEILVTGVTLGLFLILQLYYLITYTRPLRVAKSRKKAFQSSEVKGDQPPVSIIVYAKNDAEKLRLHLPSLLAQDYPEYEVIVINDGSTDDTDDTLKYFSSQYKNLYHTYTPRNARYVSRRKLALTLGIKAAKHELLLFTESACEPVSEHWISAMISGYAEKETKIVLGFCKYGHYKGFGQKMIAYDNLLTGIRFLSFALAHSTYTGYGRNLSYRKDLFFKHKGYSQSLNLHAGDDDLFINEAATKENTAVVYSPDSLTEIDKIEQFAIWKEMKVSRTATERYFKGTALSFFRLESLSFFLFISSAITAIIVGLIGNWLVSLFAVLLLVTRFIAKAIIFHKSARTLGQTPTTGWLFILEFVQPIFNAYLSIYRIFRSKRDYTFRLDN